MGADLCLAIAKWNRIEGSSNQESTKRLYDRIDALSRDLLVICAEQLGLDPENWTDDGVKHAMKSAVEDLVPDNRRDTSCVCIEGSWYMITGGMSWGDPPTDAYPWLCAIDASGITVEPF